MEVVVGVSNRHVHLTKEDLEMLFGVGYELKKRNQLKQKGQYAAEETVTIETVKNKMEKVRIIGPIRIYTQVEISKTDSYFLGINPPYRDSGDLANSESITIIGPMGKIDKKNCCIIPVRHLHVDINNPKYNNHDKVLIKINNEKGGILDNVYIKKDESSVLELHLDTDDANGFNLHTGDIVEVIDK